MELPGTFGLTMTDGKYKCEFHGIIEVPVTIGAYGEDSKEACPHCLDDEVQVEDARELSDICPTVGCTGYACVQCRVCSRMVCINCADENLFCKKCKAIATTEDDDEPGLSDLDDEMVFAQGEVLPATLAMYRPWGGEVA